jgi:hypothetical protein
MPGGRPSDFTPELGDKICEELALGKSMRTVCAPEGMPDMSTVFRWIRKNEEFRNQYARAKEEATDAMAEDMLDIADDGSNDLMTIVKGKTEYEVENKEVTNRSRLRVDTRKWLMSKMKPKKYGEILDLRTNGKDIPQPLLHVLHNNDNRKDLPNDEASQRGAGGNVGREDDRDSASTD